MSEKLQITLSAELESLPLFRQFIEDACQRAGIDEQACFDITLAVDEACANIIEHGYKGMNPGSIILSLQYGKRQVVVRLTDFGHPFEPGEPPQPDIEDVVASGKLGGFGLYFIHRSVDRVDYTASEGGNCLTLVKRFTPAGASEQAQKGES